MNRSNSSVDTTASGDSSCSDKLLLLRDELLKNNYAFVCSESMKELLTLERERDDNDRISHFWELAVPQRDEKDSQVYPDKKSMVSYYNHVSRTSGLDHSIEHIDPTTEHDVSFYRIHKAWPEEADDNEVMTKIRSFVFSILGAVIGVDTLSQYEAMQTAYRVTKGPGANGDPGPEGVHQDSADLTVVMLIGRDNVDGGVNRVWTLDQDYGKPKESDMKSERLLLEHTLKDSFDTLLILDRNVKHEASSIFPMSGSAPAIRDVLTFEVRLKKEEEE